MPNPTPTPIPTPFPHPTPTPSEILMAKRFGHNDSAPNTALVLSGGGAKGSFEVGALAYLTRKEIWGTINLHSVCGTSVGSINALKIVEKGNKGIEDLVTLYLSLKSPADMFEDQQWLKDVKQIAKRQFGQDLDKLGKQQFGSSIPGIPNMPAALFVTLNIVTLGILGIVTLSNVKKKIEKLKQITDLFLEGKSLYNLNPIERKIKDNINPRWFHGLSGFMEMRLAVVSLEDGKTWYVTESGRLIHGNAKSPEREWDLTGNNGMMNLENALVQGAIASAAIPVIFESKQLRADPYKLSHFVDGGVRDVLPLRAALELGAKRIISIMAGPLLEEEQAGSYYQEKMIKIGARSLDIAVDEIKRNELDPEYGGCPDDVQRIDIIPEVFVHDTQEVNPGLIGINMAYGYMRCQELTLKSLLDIDIEERAIALWANTREIVETRKRIWNIEHNLDGGGPLFMLKRPEWQKPASWVPEYPWNIDDINEATEDILNSVRHLLPQQKSVVFNAPMLDFLRTKKHKLLKLVEERLELLNYDPYALPLFKSNTTDGFTYPDGEKDLNVTQWWDKWELHGFEMILPDDVKEIFVIGSQYITVEHERAKSKYDLFLKMNPLWERLPIDLDGEELVFESVEPTRPIPSPELVMALNSRS